MKEFLDPRDAALTNFLPSSCPRQRILPVILDSRSQSPPFPSTPSLPPFRHRLAFPEPSKRPHRNELVSLRRNANIHANLTGFIQNAVAPERAHEIDALAAHVDTAQCGKLFFLLEQRARVLGAVVELAAAQADAFQAAAALRGKHAGDAHDVVEVAGIPGVLEGL